MPSLRSLVQSPSSLFAFEAAARHLSFTKAGKELNISQAAVSYSIKQLEESLGVQLFIRLHRHLELTEVGARIHNDVSLGLNYVRRAFETVQNQRSTRRVTLSVSTACAGYWLVRRLHRFRKRYPEIDLRLQTINKDLDLNVEGISLGIRRGDGNWNEYDSDLFAPERIAPVCSPNFLKANRLRGLKGLMEAPLVHLVEPYRHRLTWADWFKTQGMNLSASGGLILNDYSLVLQAAIQSEWVALGWSHLTYDLLQRGTLVRPIDNVLVTGLGFYVVWPRKLPLSQQAMTVRDWLLNASRPLRAQMR